MCLAIEQSSKGMCLLFFQQTAVTFHKLSLLSKPFRQALSFSAWHFCALIPSGSLCRLFVCACESECYELNIRCNAIRWGRVSTLDAQCRTEFGAETERRSLNVLRQEQSPTE